MKRTNNLSWGLFNFRGRYFLRNIKDIPIFIKRIFFTLKHGYAPQAQWETYVWFIDTMREMASEEFFKLFKKYFYYLWD